MDSKPLVTGDTKVRFFASAPLRTQDGYNVGACVFKSVFELFMDADFLSFCSRFVFFKYSLCVMGDSPRQVFTPRQRHKLKEFAVRYAPNFKFRSRLTIT